MTGDDAILRTSVGDVALQDFRLRLAGREWSVLHTESVVSFADEQRYLASEPHARLPFGVVLWPAAIALAHDLAERGAALTGSRVLELGAGTGLPGIVAASFGADVVQTDRHPAALMVCRRNAARNGVAGVTHREADWTDWRDDAGYDLILGADVLYAPGAHDALRAIFAGNLAPGGRVLLSDPFRATSIPILEVLETDGWRIGLSKWTLGEGDEARPIGVYEMAP